ncbi:HSD17B7 [Mytilus edulis]|uniref:17beta-estradiol 17-dehydrogenase / 3beta-hydroxysteroid 3-dehydrogenase n=2 Tax=Mytilus TaxID=6548 RepID=A0A8B6DQ29_MYTGA|nr:HSD17B7 [Mytilus edulis]VDI23451.1 17beta-estradiol 17-dehydrogenase / 3beta-hydroxysteroid 3-dehydrogenase [Mytilus galloprovincialis]
MKRLRKVAVITGGNSGIGLSVCERLLTLHNNLELCLLCRNKHRAEAAKNALLVSHPQSSITIVIMDTSDVKSVFKAAQDLRQRYEGIDYLYLNAGIMPVTGVNWTNVVKGVLSSNCAHVLSTGEGCLYHTDETTKDGLKNIFASNLFGHYTLIKELEDRLGGDKDTQIIWTSSRAAMKSAFNITDIQHKNGENPYSSSKYLIDTVSVSLNNKLNKKRVYSHTTCPGLVMSNLTNGVLPYWIWSIIYPLLIMLRLFCPSLTCSSYIGSEAMVWLSTQNPQSLDPQDKFNSDVDIFGKTHVSIVKLDIDTKTEETVCSKLDELYKEFKTKYY